MSKQIVSRTLVSLSRILAGAALLVPATLPALASAASFEVDLDEARVAGSGCALGENAFLERDGWDALALELGGFRASVGSFDGAGSARTVCAVVLPGRLPRGYTVRSVRSEGTFNLTKSTSADARLAATVVGGGVRTDAAELTFPAGRSASAQGARFNLSNVIEDDGVLCNPSRGENVILSVIYAASAVKGTERSYADIEIASGRRVRLSFEVRPCR